ncbi:MAG: sigma-54-dependent Fis family transcriptional regulator, partial [Mariniphaga sp.]|nr:sigma-54-dependent Fis family transcriptional regulator [Mariniphaga sp.]
DEIADMPFNLQAKILRATEEKVVTRVGDTNPIHTDFRIVSATNQNIDKRVEVEKFRLDLLHRLNTLHIHIPALRERPEDIKPLLIHFVDVYATKFNKPNIHVSKAVFDTLLTYNFPGNVRELRNMVERAIILCKDNVLGVNDFPVKPKKISTSESPANSVNLKNHEIKLVRKALQNCKYNQKVAADLLGISRDALIRKMKKYDIFVSRGEE